MLQELGRKHNLTGKVPGTRPFNSNRFELMEQLTGTKKSQGLDFLTKTRVVAGARHALQMVCKGGGGGEETRPGTER